MKTVKYYFTPLSPWGYMGHDRLLSIAARHGAQVEPRPIALSSAVFPVSGGLRLKDRPPQRLAYRLIELQRWSDHLEVPLNLHPAHFPVPSDDASLMIVAALNRDGNDAALRLTGAIYKAVWAQDRDISDQATLISIAQECQFDGKALYEARVRAQEYYDRYTQDAIDLKVFGAPWYIYNDEPFWGQDRLDFLDRALAKG